MPFDRDTGKRPQRNARGGLPETTMSHVQYSLVCAERGGIHRREGGGGVRRLSGKNSWGFLPLGD